jgi:hypothetical protein
MHPATDTDKIPTLAAVPEKAEPAIAPAEDIADPLQLNAIESQLRELREKAAEIENQAKQLESECVTTEGLKEVGEAKSQATFIRGTVDKVQAEIHAAPTDKSSGQKKLSHGRASTITQALQHIAHVADGEKATLSAATNEVKKHSEKAKSEASTRTQAAPVGDLIRTIGKTAPVTVSVGVSQPVWHLPSWGGRAIETVKNTWEAAHTGFHQTMATIGNWSPIQTATEFVKAPITQLKAAAATVTTKTEQALQVARSFTTDYVIAPAMEAAEDVKSMAKRAKTFAGESIDAGKKKLLSFFSSEEVPVLVNAQAKLPPKQPEQAPSGLMARALQQAMALSLPIGLSAQHVSDALGVSSQNLPKISSLFGQLPSLY